MRLPPAEPAEGTQEEPATRRRTDLRLPLLGLAAWGGALLGHAGVPGPTTLLALTAGLLLAAATGVRWWRRAHRNRAAAVLGAVLALLAGLGAASLRAEGVAGSPVAALAEQGAAVTLEARVVSDPRPVRGAYGELSAVRLDVREVTGRGLTHRLSAPALVLGDGGWAAVELGSTVRTTARLAAADDPDLAALVLGASDPDVLERPGGAWSAAAALRASIREAVAHRPPAPAALVPALVDGDDTGLDADLEEDFAVTGLTHLTAVSGTNLTLVVGFLLVLARWVGVRGRWLVLVGACGVVGFVLLARTEPSVLRAAAMGTVGLLAFGLDGRDRALRALGLAVLALVLLDPPLAAQAGFALSVLATAGIVLLGPGLRDALATWLPRPLAEAVAVPLAAQLACTPVVAAISEQVSLVAVGANLLVGPVVGPATVLGLVGGLVGLVWEAAGRLVGTLAAWCVAWIVVVARHGADLPLAAMDWGAGATALTVLTVMTVAVALAAPWVLRRRLLTLLLTGVLVVVVAARPALPALPVRLPGWPGGSWPPRGWVMVACDVGQGDAAVLRAGPGAGVVVDAGPDPDLVEGCLDRLGVTRVPLVVLTHLHADHVDGLPGVLAGREVGQVLTTRVLDPPSAADQVADELADAGDAPVVLAEAGRTVRVGEVTAQVLWPEPGPTTDGAGDGSSANDASVVLLAEVRGVRVLLTGDVEPPGQARLAADLAGAGTSGDDLGVDVLKVPHHGSAHQDLEWLGGLGAGQALVSVGEDNDYGHPAPATVEALEAAGAQVHRTDVDGDLAVVLAPDGAVEVVGR